MPIIIDPVTGARKFVADNSGFRVKDSGNFNNVLPNAPAQTEAGEFAKGLRSGIEQTKGLGNSALAAGAAIVGADDYSAEQSRQADQNFQRAGEIGPRVTDFNTATESLENFGDFVAGGLGQAVPTFGAAAAGGLGGLGVKSLLRSGIQKGTAAAGGAFAATQGMETGGIFNDVINDPEARKNYSLSELAGISMAGAAPAAALDVIPLVAAAKKFGLGLSARREITSKLREFGKGIGTQALLEGTTEGAQTVIERATHNFVNKYFDILGPEGVNEILGAATIGAAFGGITGAAASAPGIIGSRMAELDQETQDRVSQAEATFDKLRKVDDPEVQNYLDLMQNEDIEDIEVQEDLDAMLKDLGLRRPKFSRAVDGPTAITPDTTKLNRRKVPTINDQTDAISDNLNAVERGLLRRRVNTRDTLSLPTGTEIAQRTRDERPDTQEVLSEEDALDNGLAIKNQSFAATQDNVIGDKEANVSFTTGGKKSATQWAEERKAALEADNPGYSYEIKPAYDVLVEQARSADFAGELSSSVGDEIIRLAQDDNQRMGFHSLAKSVDPKTLSTVADVKRHLQARKLIIREKIESALDPTDKQALTGTDIKNELPIYRREARARAYADIGTRKAASLADTEFGTSPTALALQELEAVEKTQKRLENKHPLQDEEAVAIAKNMGLKGTGDRKRDAQIVRDAVEDMRFTLDQWIKDSDYGKGEAQKKKLDKDLKELQKNTILRTRKHPLFSEEGKKWFDTALAKKKPLTKADYKELRRVDRSSRTMLFGRDATGELLGIRPHAMIQKNFQKLFGGQGLRYDRDTINAAYLYGLSDLIDDHSIVIDDASYTDDVILFTDADRHPWTIGEVTAKTKSRAVSQAKSGIEILLAREQADAKPNIEKINALEVRLLEIGRSKTQIEAAKKENTAAVKKFAKIDADLRELAQKKIALDNISRSKKENLARILSKESMFSDNLISVMDNAATSRVVKSTPKSIGPMFDALPAYTGDTNTYAGVGSRQTPANVQQVMGRVALVLGKNGKHLNTGNAKGADTAFATGARGKKTIYTPKDATDQTRTIAKEVHPNPKSLSGYVLDLQARNTNQVFGKDLDTPVDFLLAWTPNGETRADQRYYGGKDDPNNTGGTGQAIALADLKGIPVINMKNIGWLEELGKVAGLSKTQLDFIRGSTKLEETAKPLVGPTLAPLGDDYLHQRIHRELLDTHKAAENELVQYHYRTAQSSEIAKLRNAENLLAMYNDEEVGPIPFREFEKKIGTPRVEERKENGKIIVKAKDPTGLHALTEKNMLQVSQQLYKLQVGPEKFRFIMETTKNDNTISLPAAEALHDMRVAKYQSLQEELAADKETLVSIVSRYKKEATRLLKESELRLRDIDKQITQHEEFFKKHDATFEKHYKAIKEYAASLAETRALNEDISKKNTERGYALKAVRDIEKVADSDISVTNILNDVPDIPINANEADKFKNLSKEGKQARIAQEKARERDTNSPDLIKEVATDPDEFQSVQKTEFEELFGFEKNKDNMTHFANAAEISAYTRLQNEIAEIKTRMFEDDLNNPPSIYQGSVEDAMRKDYADTPLATLLKEKQLELKSFYVNRQSEPRVLTLDEQTIKGESDKTKRNQKAQRNVLKPIVAAVKQVAGRIKTTANVLSTEEAMKAFNMTRQQLLETNGMYFKGKIWVKETLSPTVMREVIAHELGHGIFENELRNASTQIQTSIRKQFDAWRKAVHGKSVHSVIQSKAAFATARKYITESRDRAISTLSTEDQAYLLDFEEWFADQVAVYESTKPTTALGKFFAKIAGLIKKLMGRQTTDSVRDFLDGIEQRNWIPSAIDRGRRFFEFARANKQITDDTLMSHLIKSAPKSMADIETISQMLPTIFTKADLALLGRAFTQGNVRSQLHRLYPNHALKAFDESVARTVAAGMVQWAHGKLQVGPKVHSVYEKAMGAIATALKGKTDMQKQNAALDAIKQGKAIWNHQTDLGLTSERTDSKKFKDVESIAEFMSSIGDVFEKVFVSASDRLYNTKNPAIIKLAQMFHSRSGTRLTEQGYFQEKQRNVGRYLSSASNVLKPLSDEQKAQVLADLRSGNHTTNEAKGMRKIFNAMYAYANKNGVEVKLRKNYVPRIWNKDEVAKRRPELEKILRLHGIQQPATAVDRLLGLEEREIEEWLIEYNPTTPQTKQRGLGQVPDQVLADANFLSNDLEYITVNYIESLVKKVEYVKRFGETGEKIFEISQEAIRFGATNDDIELIHSYIQAMMGITGHETNAALAKMLGLNAPPIGQKINPAIQQVLSTVLVIRNLALLSLAMFTSLADPLGISVRSGSLTDTGVALKTGMKEIWNSVTGQQSQVHELANALGILESHMTNVALQWEYGGTYMAPWARKVNDEFFKWTGLTGLTRLTRSMALGASHSFIARHASNPNEASLRYLEELNLTPEEVLLTPDGKSVRILTLQERSKAVQHERDRDDKVRAAMNQFVDESILRPNAAQRPIWASDPHYMLVFHLKAFMYSFHDRILRRAVTEMGEHNSVAPMVGLMMFVPALLFIDGLRDLIKYGGTPPYKANWDVSDYAFNSMERAGLFGIYQQGFDIRQAQQYGGTGAEALLGGVMFPFQLFTDPTELLPFQNMWVK